MSETRLRTILNRVRRRLFVVGGTASLCWALLVAVSVCLAGVWLDLLWELSPPWRIAIGSVAGLAGVLFLTLLLIQTTKAAKDMSAARHLDRAAGSGGMIVSGWELASRPLVYTAPASAMLTAGLARVAVEQAACLAEQVTAAQAVSARPVRRAAATLGLIAAIVAAAALCLPTLMRTELHRFLNPFADVPPYSRVRLEVTPGDTEVVYGQGLDVQVTVAEGSVEQVELVLEFGAGEPETLPMFPEPGNRWRTSLTRITVPATYFVRADRSRSVRYQIGVITVPRIEAVRFRVTPPAYTNEAPSDGPLPKGGIAGLPGTQVVVWAQSNRPLQGGSIELDTAAGHVEVPLQPTLPGGQEVSGAFEINSSGRFQLSVTDVAGQQSQDRFGASLTLLADQRPMVRLTAPQPMSLATPTADLPVAVAAEDDYGISRVQLFRSLNNSRPLPTDMSAPTPASRRWLDQIQLPLGEYDLLPGDEIKLFARVEDNDPAGAKGAESSVATVRIISQQEFEEMLQMEQGMEMLLSKYQAAQRRMEQLQEELRALQEELAAADPKAAATDQLRSKLQQLAEQVRAQAAAVNESADHLLPYDLDENLTEKLRRVARQLSEAATALENASSAAGTPNEQLAEALQKLAQQLDQDRQQFQQEAMAPLEHLALIYPLMEDESRFVILAWQQRDLSERLASFKDSDKQDDPAVQARMRELEEEQRSLREELTDLLSDIDEHVSQLPDDQRLDKLRQTASEFAAAARDSGAAEAMANAEMALAELAGKRAYDEAKRAADILEGFLAQCNGMGGKCREGLAFQPGLSNCLGNTVQQLLARAGFGSGSGGGMGQGMGSGYSARRSGQGNVGLYGGLPGLSGMGDGRGPRSNALTGGKAGSLTGPDGSEEPFLFEPGTVGDATGSSEGMIPTGYRQRVGQYFLRIAEEAKTK